MAGEYEYAMKCEMCDFATPYSVEMRQHKLDKHTSQAPGCAEPIAAVVLAALFAALLLWIAGGIKNAQQRIGQLEVEVERLKQLK